jgi:pyruvate/2-oxoglutarate dehydrogenase complex dihydrolipoamide acyltransferase (E2) component
VNPPHQVTGRPSADAIRAIVEEVVRRIRADAAGRAGAPSPAAAAPAAAPAGIPDKVITLDLVERLPQGTSRLTVSRAAVITPSARDRARERGIAIERAAGGGIDAPAARPLVVAHADAGPDAAGRTAEIVRAIPHASRLPATGLGDVVNALALHASRDGARGILLTSKPASAVILANRSASLRAVAGRDAAGLLAAATECGANLLVVNPRDLSTTSVGRLATEFVARELTVPADLATVPAGCGCKSHPH